MQSEFSVTNAAFPEALVILRVGTSFAVGWSDRNDQSMIVTTFNQRAQAISSIELGSEASKRVIWAYQEDLLDGNSLIGWSEWTSSSSSPFGGSYKPFGKILTENGIWGEGISFGGEGPGILSILDNERALLLTQLQFRVIIDSANWYSVPAIGYAVADLNNLSNISEASLLAGRVGTINPSLAVQPGSTRLLVTYTDWTDKDGDDDGVFGQFIDVTANGPTQEFQINEYAAGKQSAQFAIALNDGSFAIVWWSFHAAANSSFIAMRTYGTDGASSGPEVRISSGYGANRPVVTQLNDGGFVASWTEFSRISNNVVIELKTSVFDGFGNNVASFRTTEIEDRAHPLQILSLADGGFAVFWESNGRDSPSRNDDESGAGIFLRIFESDGTPRTKDIRVNSTVEGDQHSAVAEQLMDGTIVVGWHDGNNGTIMAQIITPQGQLVVNGTSGGDRFSAGDRSVLVRGYEGADGFIGGIGNDVLLGGDGTDWLKGGAGADTMVGGADNDTYIVDGSDDVVVEVASGGYDRVVASLDWTLDAQFERLSLAGTADLSGTGNSLANRIDGNAGSNILNGREGNDALVGGAGNDTLLGGEGNDYLCGSTGADSMVGGTGNDSYTIDNVGDTVVELAGEGMVDALTTIFSTTLSGALAEIENLTLAGLDNLSGTGNAYANSITGNAGNNTLVGGDGNDRLNGGTGADSLEGGNGNDALDGGLGQDTLTGGAGNDSFSFATLTGSPLATPDLITDFTLGADRVSVAVIDANPTLAGNQAFVWIGGAAFSDAGVAQARFFNDGVDTFAAFDLGDGGDAELLIQFNGVLALSASNFVL